MGTPPSPQMHVSHSAAYTTTMYLVANTARAVRRSAHPSHVWYCVRAYCPPDSGWPFLGRGVSLATGQRSCGCAAMGREDTPMLRARSLSTHPQGRANGRGRSPAGTVVPNCAQEPILTDLHAYRCLPPLRRKLFVLSVPSPEAQSDMGDTALRFLRLHHSTNTLTASASPKGGGGAENTRPPSITVYPVYVCTLSKLGGRENERGIYAGGRYRRNTWLLPYSVLQGLLASHLFAYTHA